MSTKQEQAPSGSTSGFPNGNSPSESEIELEIDLDDAAIANAVDDARSPTTKSNASPNHNADKDAIDITQPQEEEEKESRSRSKKDKKLELDMPQQLHLERSLSATAAAAVTTPVAVLRQLSASPRTAKAAETIQSHKTAESVFILIMFFAMTVSCFILAFNHNENESSCSKDEYSMGLTQLTVRWFLYVAGLTSLCMLSAIVYAWKCGCVPDEDESQFNFDDGNKQQTCCDHIIHFICCLSFWNMVWAILGFVVYGDQMNEQCRKEAAPIMILVWCCVQVWCLLIVSVDYHFGIKCPIFLSCT